MMHRGLVDIGVQAAFVELSKPPTRSYGIRLARRVVRTVNRWRKPHMRILNAMRLSGARYIVVADGKSVSAREAELCRQLAAERGGGVAQYLCDDPFAPAYARTDWKSGLHHYDVVFSTKRQIMGDVRSAGVSDVRFLWFGFDPWLHASRAEVPHVPGHYMCDVAFAGACDRDRVPMFQVMRTRASELSLRLYSSTWGRIPALRDCARPAVYGMDYCYAMLAAHMCPCLVRRANRDGHVMRTFELLAMGCFMIAERTEEHQELLSEDQQCAMWDTEEELADKCLWYASRPRERERIAARGFEMARAGQHTYLDRVIHVLKAIGFRVP
jgi:hypothetical protein